MQDRQHYTEFRSHQKHLSHRSGQGKRNTTKLTESANIYASQRELEHHIAWATQTLKIPLPRS